MNKWQRFIAILFIVFTSFYLSGQNIFRTTCQGNLNRLDSLLSDTSIDIEDNRGRSLLHWAVACKNEQAFEYLIQNGIDFNGEDNQHKNPMHIAVEYGLQKYFDKLIELQASNKWIEKYGSSFLEIATLKKDSNFVKILIDKGIDINCTNNRGSTALEISKRLNATDISEFLIKNGADSSLIRSFEMKGKLMGQNEPGNSSKMFAPNFISTEAYEFGSVFNSKETEFYFGVDVNGKTEIRFTQLLDGIWSQPKAILTHDRFSYNDPFLSPKENSLYFISDRALDGISEAKRDIDIWYIERINDQWSEPINAGPNINSSFNEYYISFTNEGTMYFSSNVSSNENSKDQDIYYSRFIDGKFQQAVSLGDSINTADYEADVFVNPSEDYIIFCSTRESGFGRGDLYISFKNDQGLWTKSINMGDTINTKNHELCPFVTANGKYLFYTSNEDIYWIDTPIINELKEKVTRLK